MVVSLVGPFTNADALKKQRKTWSDGLNQTVGYGDLGGLIKMLVDMLFNLFDDLGGHSAGNGQREHFASVLGFNSADEFKSWSDNGGTKETLQYTPAMQKAIVNEVTRRSFSRTGHVSIDLDGSGKAYHPNKSKGTDYLANGGHPGNWWGVVTHNGKKNGSPVINPKTGYYVSSTSMVDGSKSRTDQDRYVDADVIPFVAMTKEDKARGVKIGDPVLLTNNENGRKIWAVVADYAGHRDNPHAEISMAAAELLDVDVHHSGSGKIKGASGNITQQFFPGMGDPKFFPRGIEGAQRVLAGPEEFRSQQGQTGRSFASTLDKPDGEKSPNQKRFEVAAAGLGTASDNVPTPELTSDPKVQI